MSGKNKVGVGGRGKRLRITPGQPGGENPGTTYAEELAAGIPSDQQNVFINAYVLDPTSLRGAARAAMGDEHGPEVLTRQARQWLDNPVVAHEIARRMQEREHETKTSQQRTLHELAVLGFSNIDWFEFDHATEDWVLKPGVPEYAWRAVAEKEVVITTVTDPRTREQTRTVRTKLRFWNKNDALLTIAKHLGMITTRLANADGTNLLPIDAVKAILTDVASIGLEDVTPHSPDPELAP